MGKPNIPDLQTLWQAGINPKNGLPVKFGGSKATLKEDLKKLIRTQIDEPCAVNRYVWYNLPCNITSQELERMLYYKGQLCFFFDKDLQEFYFMPYALDGTIDFYGRFNTIHPVPMTSGTDDKGNKAQAQYLANKKLKCIYGINIDENIDLAEVTVLLHDYTKQLSQTIIPRCSLNEPLLDTMAEIIPMARTNMMASCGIKGIRVNDADQQQNVEDASRSLEHAALTGNPWMPIIGNIEFQELTDNATGKIQDYFLALQSLDNFRLSTYGIDNGGLFEKKAHELQSEADINGGPVGLVLQDGLSIRQNFCNVVNSIWDLGIWCEPAENCAGADMNGDGLMYDRNEAGENSGVQSEGGEANE